MHDKQHDFPNPARIRLRSRGFGWQLESRTRTSVAVETALLLTGVLVSGGFGSPGRNVASLDVNALALHVIFERTSTIRVSFWPVYVSEYALEDGVVINPSQLFIALADFARIIVGNPALDVDLFVDVGLPLLVDPHAEQFVSDTNGFGYDGDVHQACVAFANELVGATWNSSSL